MFVEQSLIKKFAMSLSLSDLWDSEKFFYPWPTADLGSIFRPFHLSDLEAALNPSPGRKVVFVQVNQTYDETGTSTMLSFTVN